MRFIKSVLAVAIMIFLSGCVGDREPLSFQGRLSFADGEPAPPGYVLYLEEQRSNGLFSMVGIFTIEAIKPESDGTFSYNGFVCQHLVLAATFAGSVSASRDDRIWSQPIEIVADAEETEFVRSQNWLNGSAGGTENDQIEQFKSRILKAGDVSAVPCRE